MVPIIFMVDIFLHDYRDVKSKWNATIDASSQGDLKDVMNKLIWNQHILSFDQNEWGQLSNFTGLQKKLVDANKAKIIEKANNLQLTISGLQTCFDKLKASVECISTITLLYSMKPEQLVQYSSELLTAYEKELNLKKIIVKDLQTMKYINSPYEVIMTITAMWSDKVYTNDRAISHIESLLDFEVQSMKAYINK